VPSEAEYDVNKQSRRAMGIVVPKSKYPSLTSGKTSVWRSLPHDWEVQMVLPARMHEVPKTFKLFAQATRFTGSFFAYTEMEPAEDGNIVVRLRLRSTKKEDLDAR